MVKYYVTQIKMGKLTIDDVPVRFREKVKEELGVTVDETD